MNGFSLTAEQRRIYCRFADLPLPRHTSYPITPVWRADYRAKNLRADLARAAQCQRPLSLYVHVPYCQRLCYYCACTKEIIPLGKRQAHDPAEDFLRGLALEIERVAAVLGSSPVYQVHLGGGSPTFLHPEQLKRLWSLLESNFTMVPEAEIAIEIDPRITTRQHLEVLRELGFNRISLGVQDFAPDVQRAVNRIQPFELVADVVQQCRELGFTSLNFDLIYGLPHALFPGRECGSPAVRFEGDSDAAKHQKTSDRRGRAVDNLSLYRPCSRMVPKKRIGRQTNHRL